MDVQEDESSFHDSVFSEASEESLENEKGYL